MHRSTTRILATVLLAPLGLLAAERAAAQADAPAGEVPLEAGSVPIVVPGPAPSRFVRVAPAVSPVAPAAPTAVELPVEAPPALVAQPAEPPMPAPSSVSPAPVAAPPIVSRDVLPTATGERAESPEQKPFRGSDGDFVQDEKPLFKVGRYRVRASGYVQAQYQAFNQSRNELSPDGQTLLNLSGFAVPRARAIVEGGNDWSALVLEYDAANINTAVGGVQRAEATLLWRNPDSAIPYIAGTLGVFRTPFGFEAARSARERLFAENATITQAFFPGQSDTGARVEGGVAWFRYAVAFVNGHPVNEPRWGGRTPTKQGDVLGRLGLDARVGRVRFIGGASLLKGKGFSPGTPASKDSIAVRDVNESGTVTQQSVTLTAGRAATASRTYDRWGTGVDAELSAQVLDAWKLWLRGEFMFGSNLDRGLFISDPTLTGFNGRGYGAVASVESLLWQTGLIGLRYDFYDPNPDATSTVSGNIVKVPRRISTASALVGVQLPGTRTRLFLEYDRVKDHLALGLDGRPTDLKNDRFLCRLQVSLW